MVQWLRLHLPTQEVRIHSRVGKIPWRRKWQPTPGFLPGEPHGQRSLVSYSPWGSKESAMTELLSTHTVREATLILEEIKRISTPARTKYNSRKSIFSKKHFSCCLFFSKKKKWCQQLLKILSFLSVLKWPYFIRNITTHFTMEKKKKGLFWAVFKSFAIVCD